MLSKIALSANNFRYLWIRMFKLLLNQLSFKSIRENNRNYYRLKDYKDLEAWKSSQFVEKTLRGQLCILCIVSGFHNKEAPFVLLLFFHFLWSFRQNFNMFEDLSMESRNIQTPINCAPIQCIVWPRYEFRFFPVFFHHFRLSYRSFPPVVILFFFLIIKMSNCQEI